MRVTDYIFSIEANTARTPLSFLDTTMSQVRDLQFLPSSNLPRNSSYLDIRDVMDESIVKRLTSSKVECSGLDYKWLK